ncbi:crossover junction endodeoxyribonuclease RusA [Agrilactobacillus composti DSM 18527 = JCM 14202]|uniref:Crossover junction endodeoxyribonuclease RusA n=1 Tax=Agrilactobacillus composti DSM 18527 = JCM 14202 TaxID=1423734 RepID=X0PGH6_9LACO|nr:RusA family crossover junction endodeoxyribonuclease [Agrilactobacillus composti]KRM35626.1 crossover junction endodeoxyribonuclease RusA [Agrilactobacillus composti DSM 18527 = JCM 14202]GAF41144.1 phage resolvase [Agrilactobacillus composti DSM 18527 = JCM 14202]
MEIKFFMPMKNVPRTTHQQKQVRVVHGKPVFYEPDALKEARAKLMSHLGPHSPQDEINAPIRLITKWCFPLSGQHKPGEYKATKPDTDNLQKLLKDCMTDLNFWRDDALVVSEITEKFWSDIPGIYVSIEVLS